VTAADVRVVMAAIVPVVKAQIDQAIAGVLVDVADAQARAVALEHRVAAFEAKPHVKFKGVWTPGTEYDVGDAVVHSGSLWIARAWTTGKPNEDHVAWQLAVKRGSV
jgi:hypothetical protein